MKVVLLVLCAIVATVSADGVWKLVGGDFLTTDVAVCFSTDKVGYSAGDINGKGPAVFKTVDGGETWNNENASFILEVLPLGCAAAPGEPNVVVGGVVGEMYSKDGAKTWGGSVGGEVTQSVRHIGKNGDGGHKFAIAGAHKGVQGVGISVNSGEIFKTFDAGLSTAARYGAFPTDDIWYVSAGQWSTSKSNARRRSEFQDENGHFPSQYQGAEEPNGDGYMAEIAMTTDGGKTWKSVFSKEGEFYFNGIDCSPTDPKHCCAVGEASDSPERGSRIYCTTDGEKWERMVYYNGTSSEGYSLMEIRFVSDKEIWAVGGTLTVVAPAGWFLHSLDGGKTWNHAAATLLGRIALSLSLVDNRTAYTAVDDVVTQTSGVAKYIRTKHL